MKKRLFLSISGFDDLGEPKVFLKKVKIELDRKGAQAKWVEGSHLHITLNFLGETDEELIVKLEEVVAPIVARHTSFELGIRSMSAFPEPRSGRVLWLGVQNAKELRALQKDLEEALVAAGFPGGERDYVPHLTVARLRNACSLIDIMSPFVRKDFGEVVVKQVTLMESVIVNHFPVYHPVRQFSLNEP